MIDAGCNRLRLICQIITSLHVYGPEVPLSNGGAQKQIRDVNMRKESISRCLTYIKSLRFSSKRVFGMAHKCNWCYWNSYKTHILDFAQLVTNILKTAKKFCGGRRMISARKFAEAVRQKCTFMQRHIAVADRPKYFSPYLLKYNL